MMATIQYVISGRSAVIRLENPPLNSLSYSLRRDLADALDRALEAESVKVIVLIGLDKAFSSGADVKELSTHYGSLEPSLASLIRVIEFSSKPVIAAISGYCMGGGLELALACHYRVAVHDAQIAFPEVKLGLIPGAGGTQRLPRLIGLDAALNLIVGGEQFRADSPCLEGLFDHLVPADLMGAALRFAESTDVKKALPRARDIRPKGGQVDGLLEFARMQLAGKSSVSQAARRSVDAISVAYTHHFDAGLEIEQKIVSELLISTESRALRHSFTSERLAGKIDGLQGETAQRTIDRVGIVGGGTMGTGIAMVFLNAGLKVSMLEQEISALERSVSVIRKNYEASMLKGKLSTDQVAQRLGLLTPTLEYSDLAGADLVIEAVYEDMEVKKTVFEHLDKVCKQGAILASNTSYLNIDRIALFTKRPRDVIGLHFFSPANVMRLLEIVRGQQTDVEVLNSCLKLARRVRKVAVVAGVCDGFIGNRMLAKYSAAAMQMVHAGASPYQIDTALEKFGMAMGPFRMADLAGLDIGWATRKRRAAEAGMVMPPSIANLLCEAGRFGQKTGAGWYRYEPTARIPIRDPETERIANQFRAAQEIAPRNFSDDEIVERCIFSLVNEGARILNEGIASRASDIDVVFLNGYGFPKKLGGPMFYASSVGLWKVHRSLTKFSKEAGSDSSWAPAPLLSKLVEAGESF